MRIVRVACTVFTYPSRIARDSDGHAHPGEETIARAAMLEIEAEDGTIGRALAAPADVEEGLLAAFVRPVLIGADPLRREKLWRALYKSQRGSGQRFTDRVLCAADLALWDLAGKLLGAPVWKLAGGMRDRILAYGSTMCGDDLEGGLRTPEDYARYADWLVRVRGYRAVKLHTWMPPIPGAPDVRMDYKACAAVREAVGPDIPLMLDPSHWYSREDAAWLGRRLQELGFLWMEEPMEEASLSSYRWLSDQLSLNILGPESMPGKHWTRAEWIAGAACDMIRCGVWGVGGITPCLKIAATAESFNMSCEIHGTGAGNLAVCGAIPNTTYYERGLLHPFLDYDAPPPYLTRADDPMDAEGCVHLSQEPGLGHALDLDYIAAHRVGNA
ncbi:enolase C-terminal domain-like protein [Roseomonas sp. AR75]|uniref:enolase C-terminal domain-like protein n=1 Tax=Roseomonas sp. AR75 TaxID=2562311 RepID=UPI0010C0D942|nr:enolase C-terminal domain-like protein [Roseomonas sp. AR75]